MLLATLFFGATAGVISSTLNNYLSDVHGFDASERGWLELPRELPGFLIIFVVGAPADPPAREPHGRPGHGLHRRPARWAWAT